MNRFLQTLGALVLVAILLGAGELRRIDRGFDTVVVTADEVTAVRANDPANIDPRFRGYTQVCWKANYSETQQRVYIATHAITAAQTATDGWVVVGTEKECHDWNSSVPLFIIRENLGGDKEMRFHFLR